MLVNFEIIHLYVIVPLTETQKGCVKSVNRGKRTKSLNPRHFTPCFGNNTAPLQSIKIIVSYVTSYRCEDPQQDESVHASGNCANLNTFVILTARQMLQRFCAKQVQLQVLMLTFKILIIQERIDTYMYMYMSMYMCMYIYMYILKNKIFFKAKMLSLYICTIHNEHQIDV